MRAPRPLFPYLCLLTTLLLPYDGHAYVSQVDGDLLPVSNRMQACLDRAVTGETMAGAVNQTQDAGTIPDAFRPVENPPGSGHYPVTFNMIGEGAGYVNLFGY